MKKRSVWAPLYLALVLLMMYLPVIIVVLFSFNGNSSRSAAVHFEGLSLQWYEGLFSPEKGYLGALMTSLRIALMSVMVSAVIGTLGAVGLLRRKLRPGIKGRAAAGALTLFEQLSMLPIMIPEIIRHAFLALFSALHMPFGEVTLVISHISFCVPYIPITVKDAWPRWTALQEAARTWGRRGPRLPHRRMPSSPRR